MANSIRGDGLFQAEKALTALAEHPKQLDRARLRFSQSPPSYTSQSSQGSTLSNSPNGPPPEQNEQEVQARREHNASTPFNQMRRQQAEERKLIFKEQSEGIYRVPVGVLYDTYTFELVKSRWQEQGIWSERWKEDRLVGAGRRWKHEEPLHHVLGCDSGSENDAEGPFISSKRPRTKGEKWTSLTDEQRAKFEHDREASRPIYQFLWQLNRERGLISKESKTKVREAAASDELDINTKAYENVKRLWEERRIWDIKWGIMPGMSWKHERPLERT
ncbi:MAG: hypothetical protein Q9166_007117 [cf. Caloplaca sp. 2 TL-2023]